jgi:hypothetical protein
VQLSNKLKSVTDSISETFERFSILIYKDAKHSKKGIIDGESMVMIDNRLDLMAYYLLENSIIKTDNHSLNQTIDYNIAINIVFKTKRFSIEKIEAIINSILFQNEIFSTNIDYNSDRNLVNDWAIDKDKYPYDYTAITIKAIAENLNLMDWEDACKIDC